MSNYCNKNLDNELDDVVKFKFYVYGVEESKINEFEEMEKKYYENMENNFEPDEFYFFEEYWREWWEYNSNIFWGYMEKTHGIFKASKSGLKGFIEFEINKIVKERKNYEVIYEYDVVNNTGIIINIIIQRMIDEEGQIDKEDKYDNDLENIKIDIKNFWINRLEERKKQIGKDIVRYKCIWIEDTQSLDLSNKAYSKINIIENSLRTFINKIMLNRCGLNWQGIFLKSKVEKNYSNRTGGYKAAVKNFSDIDDFLLSIDAMDLVNLMDYEEEFIMLKDVDNKVNELNEKIKNTNSNIHWWNAKKVEMLFDEIVNKNKIKSKSVWENYFSDLFDIKDKYGAEKSSELLKSNFREQWREFCMYRNHIAHNKFIDSIFFNDLQKLINELKYEIDEAEKEFSLVIENEKNSSSWNYDLVFVSKKDREKIIHQQLIELTCNIVNEFKCRGIDINIGKGFRYYVNESKEFEDEVKIFINKTRNSVKAVKIFEVQTDNKITLQLTRKKGELCSYIVEFLVNENFIKRTEIGHDGHGFCCEGYGEITGDDNNSEYYRAVIGQSWDYWADFKNNIIGYLHELLNKICR
ncbi:hypothetical protein CPAST_c24500 [Clostridium pasteurianum DSM 525 = ATCC 6013]|uniref:Apea-like HEPN domain-containing protein n=2 Tax=Clostridium pasteurianum TaxID=1501 RepID=A0A0H3JAF6_CLOPA|nr:hypothetical protein [Clostridium pasteurianum]AJA48520.1 hypothetical protein CPAST_c24500 [Clostridium pasteurianum DSM 525 = ATCC 6013]AJA52508.1 hypothetical protein CLPA_c24500 [Clostridium pasteurianum DSM 525 = ATCC 6013]AOZ75758.1 hypothetical protein AQ983_11910 [Clostridium pasteurianum DSM 525 = ATCC 6013]AOZ79554.1 hypothetical protein AQ984_11905 [Clostridium pasteurianum]ELP57998.1 hypothetical protein F502_17405 [Clostridium pasteurianum DSM 525 = ATCC 6013]